MNLQCWKCGEPLLDIIFPFSRFEECRACHADQHVCRLCVEYNASVANACREDRAEFVLDKEKANFCDFFKPQSNAFKKADSDAASLARAKLAELFGEEPAKHLSQLDDDPTRSEADKALAELKRLFGE